ncbi:hypothetical protein TNIN_120351, partial [Trichonephila inaurata madagascariensis]
MAPFLPDRNASVAENLPDRNAS